MTPRKIKNQSATPSMMTIRELLNLFIQHCQLENFSPATVQYYNNMIHIFGLYTNLDDFIDVLSEEMVENYTTYLQSKTSKDGTPLHSKTINSYLIGLRSILNWSCKQGYIKKIKVVIPRTETPLKATYTEQQIRALIQKPDLKTCSFTDIRDWAIINYFIGTGQRLSTVISIKIKDLDLENKTVMLRKLKNRTEVVLPLASAVVSVLKEYLKCRKGSDDEYLFCNSCGNQLSIRGAQDCISYYNRNRGVSITSVHAFRHTFAKRSLLNGMDVVTLQQLLTHKDLNSTRIYLTMTTEDLRGSLEDHNPLSPLQDGQKKGKIKIEQNE